MISVELYWAGTIDDALARGHKVKGENLCLLLGDGVQEPGWSSAAMSNASRTRSDRGAAKT